MDWTIFGEVAGILASLVAIIGGFYFSTRWMFDKLNKNTVLLAQNVDAMRKDFHDDMTEIRRDSALAHSRINETNKRIDETNRRIDDSLARVDETNRRIDDSLARVDETNKRIDDSLARVDETNKRIDETLERIDRNFIETVKRLDETNRRLDEKNRRRRNRSSHR